MHRVSFSGAVIATNAKLAWRLWGIVVRDGCREARLALFPGGVLVLRANWMKSSTDTCGCEAS